MGKSYGEIFHEMFTMPNVQWPDVWQAILETLYMTIVSTIFAFYIWFDFRCVTFPICEESFTSSSNFLYNCLHL